MYSPHILRNISRRLKNDWLTRLTVAILVIGSFLRVIITTGSKLTPGNQPIPPIKGARSKADNFHLQAALKHSQNLLEKSSASELEKAKGDLEIYLELKQNNPYALRLLETLDRKSSRQIDEQIARTNEILKMRPDYTAAWIRLSILYQQKGDDDLASKAIEQAKKMNSADF